MRLAWLFVVYGGLSCTGCLMGLDLDHDHEEHPEPTPIVSIATGAQVSLLLERGGLCAQTVGAACLSERPETILDVVVGNEAVVELGTRTLDPVLSSLVVNLHALEPGSTTLEVTYVDIRGDEITDTIDLRVADLDRVELDVLCPDHGHSGTVFPVTSGAEVPFRHEAFDVDGNLLATGHMEVVEDFGGFTNPGPPAADGDIRFATAPTQPGSHPWPLVGAASETPVLTVFFAGQFDLTLTPIDTFPYPVGVRVGRVVDGAPLCLHEGDARADIEVVAGPCLPMVAGTEIVGPLPVSLAEHDVEVGLSGVGQCEMRATLVGGPSASSTLAVDNPAPVPQPGTGTELSPTPIEHGGELEQHGTCVTTTNLSNGNCEIVDAAGVLLPDPDCLFDVEWRKHHYDGTNPDELDDALVAVGLATELRVGIRYELVGLIPLGTYAPNDLRVVATPPDLLIDSNGCTHDDEEVLALVPESASDYSLEIMADNAFGPTGFELRARDVERFAIDFGTDEVATTDGGTDAWFFVGNRVEPTLRYEDVAGNQLHGTGPILASSDDASAGATIANGRIDTGVAPNAISLSATVAPQVHRIRVVDAASVAGVQGLSAQQLAVDTVQCFDGYPVGTDGLRIHGQSPVRPQLQLVGDDAVIFEIDAFTGIESSELCLRGTTAGTTTLELDWGAASAQAAWTVL